MALTYDEYGRFKRNKFKALVHYICWKTQDDPSRLGATKLNKVLWYAETQHFLRTGQPLTGDRYIKRQYGPAPISILPIVRELEEEGQIFVRDVPYFQYGKKEYISLKEPDIDTLFSASDIGNIDRIIDAVCDSHTAKTISNRTHNEPWHLADLGEELPLFTALAIPAEITESDMQWADDKIAARRR